MKTTSNPARWTIAAVLTVLLTTAGGCGGGSNEPEDPPPGSAPGMETFYAQEAKWHACGDDLDCTTVEVPLDYARPRGERLKLALVRLPATKKSERIGSLFVNPGGPGASGVSFIRQASDGFGEALRERFDLIGFDPRGVGQSSPVDCLDGPALDRFFGADASPDSRAELAELTRLSKGFADGCRSAAGRMLPHVGTLDAARDIDVLRASVGDDKLNYVGLSYGTYLGAYYADLFPRNARAVVLDGAVDPRLSAIDMLVEQSKGFETALRAFAQDCANQPDCPLGRDTESAVRKISQLQRRADRSPLSGPRPATESLVTMGIGTALYDKRSWPTLRLALTQAYQGNGSLLLQLADQLVERRPDGTYSNQMAANMAINCVDKTSPGTAAGFAKEVAKANRSAPRFGAWVTYGGLPCLYWAAKPDRAPAPPSAPGARPILVIGTTRDPATPYHWAQNLAGQLQSGVLLTFNGDGHTAYLQGNPCITQATEKYLITGTPPDKNTRCG